MRTVATWTIAGVLAGVAVTGCAAAGRPAPEATVGQPRQAARGGTLQPTAAKRPSEVNCDPVRDRTAILALAGAFEVSFAFDETESLHPGYRVEKPYRAAAKEVVSVLEQSDRRIVLQHVLLIEKHSGAHEAMKHWRQDWTFEDRELLEFRGGRTWQQRVLSEAQARCTWTQAVYEVDDGPRYESYGRFEHDGKRASWTSQSTHRPLPRREYTHRDDYDLIIGLNRHVVDEDGWLHEQDNLKVVSLDGRKLARERGLNRYRRVKSSETALADQYLQRTGGFWAQVRAEWEAALEQGSRLVIHREVSGKPLYEHLFPMAESLSQASPDARRAQIRAAFTGYVEPMPPAAAESASR